MRNMPTNWLPRTFGLTHRGLLVYYEAPTIQEAERAHGGLAHYRQALDLTQSSTRWSTPTDMHDGPTEYMLMIEHHDKRVDGGTRVKLCANTKAELDKWIQEISVFCPAQAPGAAARAVSPIRSTHAADVRVAAKRQEEKQSPPKQRRRKRPKITRAPAPKRSSLFARGGALESILLLAALNLCIVALTDLDRLNEALRPVVKPLLAHARLVADFPPAIVPTAPGHPHAAYLVACLAWLAEQPGSVLDLLETSPFSPAYMVMIILVNIVASALLLCGHQASAAAQAKPGVEEQGRAASAGYSGREAGYDQAAAAAGAEHGALGDDEEADGHEVEAGRTVQRVERGPEPPMPSFSYGDEAEFPLRTKHYMKTGKKAPSSKPLYELIGLDVYKTHCRVDRIFEHLSFPWDLPDTKHPDVPPLLIFNVQFPTGKQSILPEGDGRGASVVFYFRITQETLTALHTLEQDASSVSPALRLLAEWCRLAPDDPAFRARFKCIGWIQDIEKYRLPSISSRYNGKPVLIKKTGSMYRGPNFIEMDVNVHRFTYPCRACLIGMKEMLAQMVIRAGFCIEGRCEEELPEVLLGCANINGVSLEVARDLE